MTRTSGKGRDPCGPGGSARGRRGMRQVGDRRRTRRPPTAGTDAAATTGRGRRRPTRSRSRRRRRPATSPNRWSGACIARRTRSTRSSRSTTRRTRSSSTCARRVLLQQPDGSIARRPRHGRQPRPDHVRDHAQGRRHVLGRQADDGRRRGLQPRPRPRRQARRLLPAGVRAREGHQGDRSARGHDHDDRARLLVPQRAVRPGRRGAREGVRRGGGREVRHRRRRHDVHAARTSSTRGRPARASPSSRTTPTGTRPRPAMSPS